MVPGLTRGSFGIGILKPFLARSEADAEASGIQRQEGRPQVVAPVAAVPALVSGVSVCRLRAPAPLT